MTAELTAERVLCETPSPGKQPTRIEAWKYDAVRGAILNAIDESESVAFNDLMDATESHLDRDELERLGSVPWYVTTVKLDMEVKGEIERVPNVTPQQLRRA